MYLYGLHPCLSALQNPDRSIEKVYVVDKKLLDRLPTDVLQRILNKTELASKEKIAGLLPKDAVHQGIALKVQPLAALDLSDVLRSNDANQILVCWIKSAILTTSAPFCEPLRFLALKP